MSEKKLTQNSFQPKIILGIAAHPDDLDFSSSGTMAYYAQQGAQIYYLILSDGGQGTNDIHINRQNLSKIRAKEQSEALKVLGGQKVYFLHYPDGHLINNDDLKIDIIKIIRTVKPDTVVTMDPSVLYSAQRGMINHPDHRVAGQAALDCVYPLARDHLSYPELFESGFLPHKTKTVLLTNFNQHNFLVDISTTINLKIQALAKHASQIDQIDQVAIWLKANASKLGQEINAPYAEGFIKIDLRD